MYRTYQMFSLEKDCKIRPTLNIIQHAYSTALDRCVKLLVCKKCSNSFQDAHQLPKWIVMSDLSHFPHCGPLHTTISSRIHRYMRKATTRVHTQWCSQLSSSSGHRLRKLYLMSYSDSKATLTNISCKHNFALSTLGSPIQR